MKNSLNNTTEDISAVIALLIQFQEISRRLDNLVEEINVGREEMLKEEKKYQAKKLQHEKHMPYLENTRKEYEVLQKKLRYVKEQIENDEEKKKKIKTIKEFKAINKQIDEHNRNNAILENELLTKTDEMEFKEEKVKLIEESMTELEDLLKTKKEDLEALVKERNESIKKLTAEKKKIEDQLPTKVVLIFNRVYKHKDKTAIVRVYHQECYGCHMKVPLQIEVDVRKKKEIVYCTNCSRILYWEEDDTDDLNDSEDMEVEVDSDSTVTV